MERKFRKEIEKMLKKSLIAIAVVAMLAVPGSTLAGGIVGQQPIPVDMVVDKIVTLTVTPARILLHQVGAKAWEGSASVHMENNFRVLVSTSITGVGPNFGVAANYRCDIAPTTGALVLAGAASTDSQLFDAAPPPVGLTYLVGARVDNIDLTFVQSSTTEQQVAKILLTVNDAL